MTNQETTAHLFEIADQFNRGAEHLSDQAERIRVAQINLRAGRKANASVAYASALTYFSAGVMMLPKDSWENQYELFFSLQLGLAECEYLLGRYPLAEKRFALILTNARSIIDRVKVHRVRMRLYQISGRHYDTVTVLIEALQLLGVTLPDTEEEIRRRPMPSFASFRSIWAAAASLTCWMRLLRWTCRLVP